jgi:hypothetical protein
LVKQGFEDPKIAHTATYKPIIISYLGKIIVGNRLHPYVPTMSEDTARGLRREYSVVMTPHEQKVKIKSDGD